jgi:uracil phosphoribosyltransferase
MVSELSIDTGHNDLMPFTLLEHPLAGHLVAQLRDVETAPEAFRKYARILTTLLVLEATKNMATETSSVQTPIAETTATRLAERLVVVPILRAGLGMLESAVELFPYVSVGYIGLERHEETAIARSYYCKLPKLDGTFTLCLDPMLATGGSASQAISLIQANGGHRVAMVCVVAAPEGVAKMQLDHPSVPIFAAALDSSLDSRKFIVPGLGDFGDRLYGTVD